LGAWRVRDAGMSVRPHQFGVFPSPFVAAPAIHQPWQPLHLYIVERIRVHLPRVPPFPSHNAHGVPAGAVYGSRRCCGRLVRRLNKATARTHLRGDLRCLVEDPFRTDIYDKYKAPGPRSPPELIPAIPAVRAATRAFSVRAIETMGLEADDIIRCYARAGARGGRSTTIVSYDKDDAADRNPASTCSTR